jgi:nitrogen fixation protein FixH
MKRAVLPAEPRRQGLQGRHVLALFLAFFGAVFLVNGAMIYSALSTHTGLVANEPYRKGLAYNERIAADERQSHLGWSEAVELARDGAVTLAPRWPDGRPVSGFQVSGVLGRPATYRNDTPVAFAEAEPGRYVGRAVGVAEGSWLLSVEVRERGNDEPLYRSRRRLWLEPLR